MRILLTAVVFFLVTTNSIAQVPIGAGAQSCGAWTEARKGQSSQDKIMFAMILSWVQGYLTGLALGLPSGSGRLGLEWDFYPPDNNAIQVWLENHCKGEPLKRIIDAASQLAVEAKGSKPR